MSKACFGVEQLFAKELRRRSRLDAAEAAAATDGSEGGSKGGNLLEEGDDGVDETGDDDEEEGMVSDEATNESNGGTPSKLPSASTSHLVNSSQQRSGAARRSNRRFGVRRPKSRKQKEEMAKLREVSMRIGGAQYFKKRSTDAIACEKCGRFISSRLSQHAYSHLEGAELYLCPQCTYTHFSRYGLFPLTLEKEKRLTRTRRFKFQKSIGHVPSLVISPKSRL